MRPLAVGQTAEQLRLSYVYGTSDDAWMPMGGDSMATLLMTPRLYSESREKGLSLRFIGREASRWMAYAPAVPMRSACSLSY
jgi:hypothetical protein